MREVTTTSTADAGPAPQLSTRDRLLDVRRKLDELCTEQPEFGKMLSQSLDVVRRALDDFGGATGDGGLAISFNGGKDACVVLYLLLVVLAERDQLDLLPTKGIPVVYFEKEEFAEVEAFMDEISKTYRFEFVKYASSYEAGMRRLVDSRGVKGVIMGQRRGDPWTTSMKAFTPSSPGWPKFTRVNPALEWKFSDVWRFLRGSGLPYCSLYDQGYTSLGERGDTQKNEALRLPSGVYRPAYELAEEEAHLERSPRSSPAESSANAVRHVYEDDKATDSAGGSGGEDGDAVLTKAVKRLSTWDRRWDSGYEAENANVVHRDGGALSAMAGGHDTRLPDADELDVKVAAGPGDAVARKRCSNKGGEVLEPAGPHGARLSTQGQGLSRTSWVGSGVRWLPLTAIVGLVLATTMRRLGGGRESFREKGR